MTSAYFVVYTASDGTEDVLARPSWPKALASARTLHPDFPDTVVLEIEQGKPLRKVWP